MRTITTALTACIIGSAMPACATSHLGRGDGDVDRLAGWLVGSFSSAQQAEADPEHYLDIRLHMTQIWTSRADGPWLYVEQAAASALERPYRQRVYRLASGPDGAVLSHIYMLPGDPLAYAGWWRTPASFDHALTPTDLDERDGCAITMHVRGRDGAFVGGTTGRGCVSTLRGAAYATSEVEITADALITWDRGFDAEGAQVWGATEGGYVFRRMGPVSGPSPRGVVP